MFLGLATLGACNGEIYVRNGVTDGDVFSIQPVAAMSDDPVTQSWIRYSLARSVCQLEADVPNPARASSFRCELTARQQLIDAWQEHRRADSGLRDPYLDDLRFVAVHGYLEEYVAHHFARSSWIVPSDLSMREYQTWQRQKLRGHRPATRIVGSWSYRPHVQNVH